MSDQVTVNRDTLVKILAQVENALREVEELKKQIKK
jgi:hypothetical protein